MKKILAIIGSTRANSSNLSLVKQLEAFTKDTFEIIYYNGLTDLPHFNPDIDKEQAPKEVQELRKQILNADGILICTPEYVFSLPGSLKNAIEWCVSTAVFSQKPIGLITASASGEKAHEELQLVMKTVDTKFTPDTTLLIKSIKAKFNSEGELIDEETKKQLQKFANAFQKLLEE